MHFIDTFNRDARELEKRAFIPEAARAGAKLLGKSVAKQDIAERTTRSAIKKMQKPVKKRAWDVIKRLEAPATTRLREAGGSKMPTKLQKKLMTGVRTAVDNPEFVAAQPIPVPGASVLAVAAKKGARKALRAYAPRNPAAMAA